MLKLGETDRELLNAAGALTINSEGEETLCGLTVPEAHFVLAVERGGTGMLDEVGRAAYTQLRALHAAARVLHRLAAGAGGSGRGTKT